MRSLSSCLKTGCIFCALCFSVTLSPGAEAATIAAGTFEELIQAAGRAQSNDTINLTADITLDGDVGFPPGVTGLTIQGDGGPFTLQSSLYGGKPLYGLGVTKGDTLVFQNTNVDGMSFYMNLGDTAAASGKVTLKG